MPDKSPPAPAEIRARGVVLPAMLLIYVFGIIMILLLAHRVLQHSRSSVRTVKSARGAAASEGGIQLGLARLSDRVSFIPQRIAQGTPLADATTAWLTNADLARYDADPGLFWTENFAGAARPFPLPAGENEFSSPDGGQSARFTIDTPTHTVLVSLVRGNFQSLYGYNDFILRYGYRIESTDKASGKVTRISSYLSDNEAAIQVRLARPLSRYNLFAENNTTPPADGAAPIYDATSYTGRVYSRKAFYVQGSPAYGTPVELSTEAVPAYVHKTDPGFTMSTAAVDVLALPGSLEEGEHRSYAYRGFIGPPPPFGLPDGIYLATASVADAQSGVVVSTVAAYLKGTASVCMQTLPLGTTTLYHVRMSTGPPPCNGVYDQTFPQHLWNLAQPSLLIFADGALSVQGEVGDRTQLTLASRDGLVIAGSVTYRTPPPGNPNTVIGLVSWQGHILLAKDIQDSNPRVHAVVMAPSGGFGSEGYANFAADYTEYKGTVNHVGAFIRKWAIPTRTACSGSPCLGWGLTTQYDPDLENNKAPPLFPGNGRYELRDPDKARVTDFFYYHTGGL